MGFIEYYKKYNKNCQFFSLDRLPEDVKNDLIKLLDKGDRRIGFFVTHSFEIDSNGEPVNTKMGISYYVRAHFPTIIFNYYHIPCGIRIWRMFKTAGGCY